MRRKFARQYGFVVPEIKLTDDIKTPAKTYQIRIHGTVVATQELRVSEFLVIVGDGKRPNVPGDEVREPAFGMKAMSISQAYHQGRQARGLQADRPGVGAADALERSDPQQSGATAVLQGHARAARPAGARVQEADRRHLSRRRFPIPGLQAVLKLLLAERVSIRNLNLILEAIAEIAPHVRRPEQIVEHVRVRMAQQICGDIQDQGVLRVLRLGNRWDLVFHQSLKRDAKGEVMRIRHRSAG